MIRAALIFILLATPATASRCIPRAAAVERLETVYGESLKMIGTLTRGDVIMEIFASDKTGSWTLVFTGADGLTCFVASGEGFINTPPGEAL